MRSRLKQEEQLRKVETKGGNKTRLPVRWRRVRNRPAMILALEREGDAIRLRAKGLTYREMATEMGCGVRTAFRALQRGLCRYPGLDTEEARVERGVLLLALDELWSKAWGLLHSKVEPHLALRTLDTLLAIQKLRAKLVGLDI
jgi:hypothetical protein